MTIASEITRIKTNIENTYTALEEKGATMPEVQNSANLADTVATVSTGGGSGVVRGVWTVPELYLQLDNEVENDAKLTELNTTYQQLFGFGAVIDKRLSTITVTLVSKSSSKTAPFAFRTSDGAYYEYSSETPNVTHTFASSDTDHWLIFYSLIPDSHFSLSAWSYFKNQTTLYCSIKYLVFNCDIGSLGDFPQMESFNLLGNHIMKSPTPSTAMPSYVWNTSPTCPLKYVPDISHFENNLSDRTTFSDSGNSYVNARLLPYGTDLSSIANDVTFGYTGNNLINIPYLYVTLPPVNITFRGSSASYPKYEVVALSYENWEYLAEHAPTVEGKTLKMNAYNYNLVGGAGSEIVTAFEAKGWTVSAT